MKNFNSFKPFQWKKRISLHLKYLNLHFNLISALTVRFLTKRYIGEYSQAGNWNCYKIVFSLIILPLLLDKVHKHEILVDTEAVLVELWDTCMVIFFSSVWVNKLVLKFEYK